MPRNINDTLDTCPGFDSVELLDEGEEERVTTMTYQRLKFRLYCIASPITRDVYFKAGRSTQEICTRVQEINQSLLEWEQHVPPELRPGSFPGHLAASELDPITRVFRLQALSLELSYHNIQLVLHRPLLVYSGIIRRPPSQTPRSQPPNSGEIEGPHPLDRDAAFLEESRAQCWKSATKVSKIDEYPEILKQTRNTHTAGYAGIQTFTAGVMLAIFALSQPFSPQAQEAKRGIGRLIKLPKHLGYRTAISDQSGHILQKLLRLILAQEMKMLTTDDETATHSLRLKGMDGALSTNRVILQETEVLTSETVKASDSSSLTMTEQEKQDSIQNLGTLRHKSWNTQATTHLDGNFNDALQSLQQGMLLVPQPTDHTLFTYE